MSARGQDSREPHDGHRHHGHGPEGQHHNHARGIAPGRDAESGRLKLVLFLTGGFMVAEVVGGIVSGSLALLADAGHMFTDAGSLALALVAMRWARRPPTARRTYGWVRMEILAALFNGATLLLMAGFIVWEAWRRLHDPVVVDGPVLLAVASVGLVVNLVGAKLLHAHAGENLNVRGAYLHVLGDLLGSVGTIAAGVVILTTGWMPADPIVSAVIALLILVSAWRLVREATDVLLEASPAHVDVEDVLAELRGIDDLHDIHDLHVWTLTSGFVALSGHGVIDDPARIGPVLDAIRERAREHGIEHVTFQLEPRALYRLEKSRGAGPDIGPQGFD